MLAAPAAPRKTMRKVCGTDAVCGVIHFGALTKSDCLVLHRQAGAAVGRQRCAWALAGSGEAAMAEDVREAGFQCAAFVHSSFAVVRNTACGRRVNV